MTLADEISQLRNDCHAALDASHNYYSHTRNAWRLVDRLARSGHGMKFRNQHTGNTVDQTELPGLAYQYIRGNLASSTFQHFVSLFEQFLFDLIRRWLCEYPGRLSNQKVDFRTVLDAADKQEIVAQVVQKEVLGLAYKRVTDWFVYLEKLVKLGCPSQEQIQKLAEIKASRDILVHNNGVVNDLYIQRSDGHARFTAEDRLELPEDDHRESCQLIKQVVSDIAKATIERLD